MMKKAHSAIPMRIIAMALAVAGALMFMPVDTYAETKTTQANVNFEPGVLSLSSVVDINFGKQKISAYKKSYVADKVNGGYIAVKDLRGSDVGWKLTAALSEFTIGLDGASITVTSPTVISVGGNETPAPTAGDVTLTANGASDEVFTAAAGQGKGEWQLEWLKTNTKLTVLAGTALAGASAAAITWTLQDTP